MNIIEYTRYYISLDRQIGSRFIRHQKKTKYAIKNFRLLDVILILIKIKLIFRNSSENIDQNTYVFLSQKKKINNKTLKYVEICKIRTKN